MSVDRKLLSVDERMRLTAVIFGTGNHDPLHPIVSNYTFGLIRVISDRKYSNSVSSANA